MNEKLSFKGFYRIKIVNLETGKVLEDCIHNVVCQGFFDGVWAFLNEAIDSPSVDALNLTYFAVGDGTTPAMRADTVLENETFRKALSTKSYIDTKFTAKVVIGASEGNPTGEVITEVGIFAGGSAAADSGTLISRAVVNIPKNANIQLIITWTLTA